MAKVYQEYFGQFYLDSARNDFSVTRGTKTNAITLTNALYFMAPYDAETNANTATLTNHIAWKIEGASGALAKCNCYFNHSDGLIRITMNGSHNITWTDSGLQGLLGFTGSQINANAYTATRSPRYTWRPAVTATSYPTRIETFWNPKTTTRYVRSKDGSTHSVGGNLLYDATITYQFLSDAQTLKGSVENYQSFQTFYEDVVQAGMPIRVYPDRNYTNSSSYVTACWGEEEPKSFVEFAKRGTDRYLGFWTLAIPLWKWI